MSWPLIGMLSLFSLVYIAPSIVASMRGAKQETGIVLLNLFLGWTFVGWVGALIWAVCDRPKHSRFLS